MYSITAAKLYWIGRLKTSIFLKKSLLPKCFGMNWIRRPGMCIQEGQLVLWLRLRKLCHLKQHNQHLPTSSGLLITFHTTPQALRQFQTRVWNGFRFQPLIKATGYGGEENLFESCTVSYLSRWLMVFSICFPVKGLFLGGVEGLRTEGVVCCTDCKAPWGKLWFVMLGDVNKNGLDLTSLKV